MKYFGKKSLSSFLSRFMHVCWYVVLIGSIIGAVFMIIMIIISSADYMSSEIARCNADMFGMNNKDKADWETFKNLPLAIKFLMMPYFAGVVTLLLMIIKKSREVFTNFRNDVVFNKSNVFLISRISKLMIAFSIMTFSFQSLIISLLLLMLCEILKSGTTLQEEHDLTV